MIPPWAVFLIVMGVMLVIVIIVIVLMMLFGKQSNQGIGTQKVIIDFSKWESQKRVNCFRPFKDFLTGDWLKATQDKKKAMVREKGILKRPEHEIDLEDYLVMQDTDDGFTLVFNKISVISKIISKKLRIALTEIDKHKSEKAILIARNKYLEKHCDKEVIKKLDTIVSNEVKMRSFFKDKKQ